MGKSALGKYNLPGKCVPNLEIGNEGIGLKVWPHSMPNLSLGSVLGEKLQFRGSASSKLKIRVTQIGKQIENC